jgi:outer membrane protein assembly factor BamA
LTYLDLEGRMNWGANLRDSRSYYLSVDPGGVAERERAQRYTTATAFAHYPFNSHYRLEGTVGYVQRRSTLPSLSGSNFVLQEFEDDYPIASLALVGDTTRYQRFGPYHGHRFRVGVTGYTFTSGDNEDESVAAYDWDFRFYQSMTRRSLLAFRVAGVLQNGEATSLYTLGGLNQLRGFRFREFFGENVAYVNLELRFPLIDFVRWGFGGYMGPFRGFLFVDFGSAWFEDQLHLTREGTIERGRATWDTRTGIFREFISQDAEGRWVDLKGSAGFGFRVPILGLPTTWSWAKVYDGVDFSSWRSDFYITFTW